MDGWIAMPKEHYDWQWQKLCKEVRRVYPPICWICKTYIDLTLDRRLPMSYTVDHLDPVGAGGAWVPTIDRVRPAHRACNSSRGKDAKKKSPNVQRTSREW